MHIYKHENEQELYILKLIELRTGSVPGSVHRVICLAGKASTKKGVARGPGNHASCVKLAKMFDIPGVAHWNTILDL